MLPSVVHQIEAGRRFTSLDRFHACARGQIPFSMAREAALTIAAMPARMASGSVGQASTTVRRSSGMGCSEGTIGSLVPAEMLFVSLIGVLGMETAVSGVGASGLQPEGRGFESLRLHRFPWPGIAFLSL